MTANTPDEQLAAEQESAASATAAAPSGRTPSPFDDPEYRIAVVDLLGGLAYSELSAFERLTDDAKQAPSLEDKVALATMAAEEFGHFRRLIARGQQVSLELLDPVAGFRIDQAVHDPGRMLR